MAKTNEYLDEAYNTLLNLSADEQKRLEYEVRQKALRDYNSQMNTAQKYGLEQGLKQGLQQGLEQGLQQGLEQGLQQGLEQGLQQGLEQGLQQGLEQGLQQGLEQGLQQGLETARQVFKLYMQGKNPGEIAELCSLSLEQVKEILS